MSEGRHILHIRFALTPEHDPDLLQQLRRLLENFTPRVQMLETDSAAADLTGAIRFWRRDATGITELIQLRALAYYGLRSAAAVAPNRQLAAMACALTPPGKRTVIDNSPEAIDAFLRPRSVRELPGVGAKAASILAEYGLHTAGEVADVPQLTLQRLLGARAGRALHERSHGRDIQVVNPAPAPASVSAEHRFPRDELDPAEHRRALLALADDLGARLRTGGHIAQGLTCTIRYADQTATRRSRTLAEATFHTVLLARAAYAVYESLGLQRARVRGIALRADTLQPAANATRQLTLDGSDDKPLAIQAVIDRVRARFGHGVLHPASLAVADRAPREGSQDTREVRRPSSPRGAARPPSARRSTAAARTGW